MPNETINPTSRLPSKTQGSATGKHSEAYVPRNRPVEPQVAVYGTRETATVQTRLQAVHAITSTCDACAKPSTAPA